MATSKIKIIVVGKGKGGGGAGGQGKPRKKKDYENTATWKFFHLNETIKQKIDNKLGFSDGQKFAIMGGISLAKKTAMQAVNYFVNDIGRRYGDSSYQAQVNRDIEKATDLLSIGQGALMGAVAGSMFGPKGAVVGAVVGMASAGINIGFRQAERQRAYAHTMFEENNNQAYNLARAGFNALNGRVR